MSTMNESPKSKKPKLNRSHESNESSSKRMRNDNVVTVEEPMEKKIQALKRKNFITACERVSYQAYCDHRSRFQLVYMPGCLTGTSCTHHDKLEKIASEMPEYAEESFKIEMKTHMWSEAVEVGQLCITPQQYLSADVLKDIVEIILNAHEDAYAGYSIQTLIGDCQETLFLNFSTHPPCLSRTIRKCYNNFLTSSMDLKDKTFTNRTEFGCDKGIVKYCMNRLEYEMSSESKEEPLLDKYENIPVELKETVKGMHWQKEKCEIFELLDRTERIDRLMVVLESVVELLQFDLAIWHSRHTSNQGRQIMRSHRPLLAYILWSDNVLYTGAVTNNCRQILQIFVQLVHLGFPERHIKIMTAWLNAVIQTFYFCETNSNTDYPNTEKHSAVFAREFYKLFAELPNVSVIKVLEAIQPRYMTYLVGSLHIKAILPTKEDDILKIMTEFVKMSRWNEFPESVDVLDTSGLAVNKPNTIKNKLKYIIKKCKTCRNATNTVKDKIIYPKQGDGIVNQETKINQNHVVHTLLIVLQSYLDAYSVRAVQEKLDELNEELEKNGVVDADHVIEITEGYCYSVTEHFIKKYRSIYQMLKELVLIFHHLKSEGDLPDILNVFRHVELLAL